MKRILCLVFALVVTLSLTACGGDVREVGILFRGSDGQWKHLDHGY